jgi:predicted dehydrogenase
MKKICLIGCGNVGSRHLQALVKIPFSTDLLIIEPLVKSQNLGKERLSEIQYNQNLHKISWMNRVEDLKEKPDLTIISTTAIGRKDLLLKLLKMGHTRFLIEKIVCQSDIDYEEILENFARYKAKGWVNTNRRYFETYKKLKEYFDDSNLLHISVTTSNFSALATNSIHFIDFFSFFTNNYDITLNGDFLLNQLYPNKRGENFVEFSGTIIGSIKSGSTFSMTSLPGTKLPTVINIIGEDKHIMIDETNGKIIDLVNSKNDQFKFNYEHVSNLTNIICQDIMQNDDCHLTTLEDSKILHKEIFKIFNLHIEKLTKKKQEFCPIT